MPKGFWLSVNDLALLFTARPIALPLILLLVIKLYLINPTTLVYTLGLLLLSVLVAMRWSIHLIAKQKLSFLKIFKEQKLKQQSDNPKK